MNRLTDYSRSAHGGLTERSGINSLIDHVGKGREGKWKGSGKEVGHLPCIGDTRQKLRGRILATQTRPMDATTGIRGGL